MWRDADGHIVTKRPSQDGDDEQGRKRQSNAPGMETSNQDDFDLEMTNSIDEQARERQMDLPDMDISDHGSFDYATADDNDFNIALLSPPRTIMGTDSSVQSSVPLSEAHMSEPSLAGGPDMLDFLANSAWGISLPEMLNLHSDGPFDDVFQPDTSSSFNMPFTTVNNYNWLFETSVDSNVGKMPTFGGQAIPTSIVEDHFPQLPSRSTNALTGNTWFVDTIMPNAGAPRRATSPRSAFRHQAMPGSHVTDRPVQHHQQIVGTARDSDHFNGAPPADLGSNVDDEVSLPCDGAPRRTASNNTRITGGSAHRPRSEQQTSFNPPCTASSRASKNMPSVDEESRHEILDLLENARSALPDGVDVSANNPLLSLSSMQTYLNLFFAQFNVTYPLLHKPTFDPAQAETFLLLAVILLGATYGDKEMHKLAVCIHDILRAQIFLHPRFTAKPELWILQTILLVECFGKSRAGQKQHDMAHLFHGLLINLVRRSDCQSVRQLDFDNEVDDLERLWRKAVDVELRKRLAFLCFIWDTQHAVLFSQSLCMSSFELRTALPCNESTWEANSAEEWWECAKSELQPSFLTVLRANVNSDLSLPIPSLNAFSRLLILHGVMSIQWDLKRRDQASLGISYPRQLQVLG